ncbi:VWA domain-containing protein [Haloarcula sp. S1CR25-12]|uniref:VWA domain-containing protein n=1 Tax=Haloarcula saliterrae TaxID=2950534 RepID=A0ABU2FH78_9EURY|nr:VWA domain-containing protein [Haloarcula sp. S1CR25-12]MDS0261096.1 VWA domain-containing protein [Haloarcula sp. S1CR25-12]
MEDWDNDTLTAYREYRLGTDPRAEDTDGDGLSDTLEVVTPELDPTDADVNDNGVPDGRDDFDGDGLSVTNETAAGTIIGDNDTDGDGLEEGPEIHEYGTNATLVDTDADGLDDGDEIALGTDPLVPDTDGDGVRDANETYNTTASNETIGATVTITGQGNVAADTDVRPAAHSRYGGEYAPNSSVSSFVEFDTERNFSSANISLGYDDSTLGNESDAAIYRFNESLGTYERVGGTIDAANDTVTAETAHFSTYVVFNESSWQRYLESRSALEGNVTDVGPLPPAPADSVTIQNIDASDYPNITVYSHVDTPTGVNGTLNSSQFRVFENGNEFPVESTSFTEGTRLDIVFVFDDTGSMGGEIDDMKRGVSDLTGSIEDAGIDARYGLVSFKDGTHVDQELTDDTGAFQESVNGLYASGGGDGPEDSLDAIYRGAEMDFRNDTQRVVVHITDYSAHASDRTTHSYTDVSERIRTTGSEFYTVSPESTDFDTIANETGGIWMDISDSDFGVVLDDIQSSLTSRYAVRYEAARPLDGTGRRVDLYADDPAVGVGNDTDAYIAPNRTTKDCTGPDSDGDGISDYCERTGIPLANGPIVTTNPDDPDTDGDGTLDGREIDLSEKVTNARGQFAGYAWTSDPTVSDTDGDGLNDTEELVGWEVQATLSSDQSRDFVEGLYSDGSNGASHLRNWTVDSDPRQSDTNFDGLNDSQERRYRIDPRSANTDGDTLSDSAEIEQNLDPTIHDHRPPEVTVYVTSIDKPNAWLDNRATYTLTYGVDDPYGVSRIAVVHNDEVRDTPSIKDAGSYLSEFQTGYAESLQDDLSGARTNIQVRDTNGNEDTELGFSRSTILVEGAKASDSVSIDSARAARSLGFYSGITSAVGSSIEAARSFVDDPLGFVDSMTQIIGMIDELGPELIRAMADSYEQRQRTANPYSEGSSSTRYHQFRTNYYGGLLWGEVAKATAGGQAANAVKQTRSASRVADKLDGTNVMRTARTYARAKDRVGRWEARQKARGAARLADATETPRAVARRTLRPAKTATDVVRTRYHIRRADVDMDSLDDTQQRRLGEMLAENDPASARAIRRMDQDAVDDLTRLDVDASTRSDLAPKYRQLDDSERQRVANLIDREGEDGSKLARDMDGETLSDFVSCSPSSVGSGAAAAGSYGGVAGASPAGDSCDPEFLDRVAEVNADVDDFNADAFARRYENDIDDKAAFRAATKDLDTADRQELLRITTEVDREYVSNIGNGVADMRSSDAGNLDDFFAFDAGKATQVRATVLRAVGDGDFDAVTPERAYQFSNDVRELSSNPDVEGASKVINEDLTSSNGFVNANDNNVKGAMYELRVANGKLSDRLDGDATLKLSFEPDVDFDSLSSDEVSDIADELEVPESQVRDELEYGSPDDPNPEFDGFAIEADGKAMYYEAKSGDVSTRDIKGKLSRLRAYQMTDSDVSSSQIRLNSLEPKSSDKVTNKAWEFLNDKEFGNAEQFDW